MSLNSENSVVIKTEVLDDSEYSEPPCIAVQHDNVESGKRKINEDTISEKRLKSMLSHSRDIDSPVSTGSSNIYDINLKNSPNIDSEELTHVLEGMSDEIDSMLETTAAKNRLTSKHVKSILKHVITNEYVLAMVRNTMKSELNEDEELDEAVFEPKLTRSKAKELREKQHVLPWPVASPVKQTESLSKALLEDEFSDESSSDEDYKPAEVECASDEELASSKASEVDIPFCIPAECEEQAEDDHNAEHVEDEDENRLVIAEADGSLNNEEEDKIALRTRSKLCLNDTPLEAIEASFIAPDITVDMYDTHCDDEEWQKFLCDLYKPIDSQVEVQPSNEEVDDPDDDPEYNFLDDDEDLDELDLRYDRKNVKIPRDELSDLMAEIWEASPLDLNDCEEEDENSTYQQAETSCISNICIENVRSQWMNLNERLQLEQQMRMYVQLLAQSYLLSFGMPELNFINVSSKLFLDEIKMFATREIASSAVSAFYAYNLNEALNIVDDYEKNQVKEEAYSEKSNKGPPCLLSPDVQKTILDSKVFMYPELLPVCSFRRHLDKRKPNFSPAEDHLIALGLEQFSSIENPIYYIRTLLVPSKTENQLKIRIKNCKSRENLDNPIKYFFVRKEAPPVPRVLKVFDPQRVIAPKEYSLDMLPKWMKPYCATNLPSTQTVTLIAPGDGVSPVVAVVQPNKPQQKRYLPILPRAFPCAPLQQVSPVLQNCNKSNGSQIMPNKSKFKSSQPEKYVINKFRAIKPKPNTSDSSSQTSGFNNVKNFKISDVASLNDNVFLQNQTACLPSEQTSLALPIATNKDLNQAMFLTSEQKSVTVTVINNQEFNQPTPLPLSQISKTLPVANSFSEGNESEVRIKTEICDETDEEVIDNEQDLGALMTASNTIYKKRHMRKERKKLQSDLESSLALLQPNLIENKKEEKEALFANSYLLRVTETLKSDPETWERFLKALCNYQNSTKSPVQLFFELKIILKNYPVLADDFIAFLRPDEARNCGKYKEYVALRKIREFLQRIEMHFCKEPQHLLKILKTFAQLRRQTDVTSTEVLSALLPLLKNQKHLVDELSQLLPDTFPSV